MPDYLQVSNAMAAIAKEEMTPLVKKLVAMIENLQEEIQRLKEQAQRKGLEPSLNVELFTTQSARSTRTTIHQSATHTIA